MGITEKVSYLKGLAEGLKLDTTTNEGKILSQMIDILEDIAFEMQDIEDEQCDLEEGLDAVSDDLEDVEHFVDKYLDYIDDDDFDDEDYDEFDDDEEYDELDDDEEDEEDEEEDCYATTCPDCKEEIYFDESVLEDGYVECPNCGARLEFDPEDFPSDCDGCKGCDK